jgi:hypothetical protein
VTEQLVSIIGQNLIAIGLYTVSFESMVLSFRAQMHGHLQQQNATEISAFLKKCNTSDQTFTYCAPKLQSLGVLSQSDVDALKDMRKRRNHFAHAGYNEMLTLLVRDVEADVTLMHSITKKVEQWNQEVRQSNPDGSSSFKISPAIFGLYAQAARELANTKLAVADAP